MAVFVGVRDGDGPTNLGGHRHSRTLSSPLLTLLGNEDDSYACSHSSLLAGPGGSPGKAAEYESARNSFKSAHTFSLGTATTLLIHTVGYRRKSFCNPSARFVHVLGFDDAPYFARFHHPSQSQRTRRPCLRTRLDDSATRLDPNVCARGQGRGDRSVTFYFFRFSRLRFLAAGLNSPRPRNALSPRFARENDAPTTRTRVAILSSECTHHRRLYVGGLARSSLTIFRSDRSEGTRSDINFFFLHPPSDSLSPCFLYVVTLDSRLRRSLSDPPIRVRP